MHANSWYSTEDTQREEILCCNNPIKGCFYPFVFLRLLFPVPSSVNVNETLFSTWAAFTYTHIHLFAREKGVPFHPSEQI